MSGKISGGVWDLDLPHNKMLVLLAMADHANHEGGDVFPSLERIAWKTGYSYRQTLRIVKSLEDDGLLVLVRAGKEIGSVNVYRINLEAGTLKSPYVAKGNDYTQGYDKKSYRTDDKPDQDNPSDKMAYPDKTKCHTGYDIQVSHKTSVKPSKTKDSIEHPIPEPEPHSDQRSEDVQQKSEELTPESSQASIDSEQQAKSPTVQQALFQGLCDLYGYNPKRLTKTKRKDLGSVAAELAEAGCTPEQLPGLKAYCDKKAKEENWSSYTVYAFKKHFNDFEVKTRPVYREIPVIDQHELAEHNKRVALEHLHEWLPESAQ